MMEINKMEMDVVINVKCKKDGLVLEEVLYEEVSVHN